MTSDVEKISEGFEKAVEQDRDVDVPAEPEEQRRARREKEINDWSLEKGRETAAELGLELNEERLQVVEALRGHYLEHGLAERGRALGDMLDARFEAQGGRKYLRKLFPGGPVSQGMRIAGLPVPRHTEDNGFGTAR